MSKYNNILCSLPTSPLYVAREWYLITALSNFIRMADISRGVRGLSLNNSCTMLLEESTASGNTAL
jgi:hypothetical protein